MLRRDGESSGKREKTKRGERAWRAIVRSSLGGVGQNSSNLADHRSGSVRCRRVGNVGRENKSMRGNALRPSSFAGLSILGETKIITLNRCQSYVQKVATTSKVLEEDSDVKEVKTGI